MAIPASDLVKIVPRVLAGAGQDLVFNGLFLTASTLAPVHGLLTFYSAESVADYFGETSDEAAAAAVYPLLVFFVFAFVGRRRLSHP